MSRFLLAVLFLVSPVFAAEGPWQRNQQSALRLVTPYQVAEAEGEFWFGVEFELQPGWHVYWKNGGDAGYPPDLDLSATPEVTEAELLFPAPHRYNLAGGLVAFGYSDQVIYPVQARVLSTESSLELLVNVDYVVCESECIPYRYDLQLTQPLGDRTVDSTHAPRLDRRKAWVPEVGPQLSGVIEALDQQAGTLAVELPFAAGDLFFEPLDGLGLGEPSVNHGDTGSQVEIPVSRLDLNRPLAAKLSVAWTATGVDGDRALASSMGVTVPASWQAELVATEEVASAAAGSRSLWWYWLPVVLAAAFYLGSGVLVASPAVLRTAWIAGIAVVGLLWFWLQGETSGISPPVIAIGTWLLLMGAAVAFAGRRFSGAIPMSVTSAAGAASLLPAAPGIGWMGAAVLVLAVVATRPNRQQPSRLALGCAGLFALAAVVARFYVLGGLIAPTPLAGVQLALLISVTGAWMMARAQRSMSTVLGGALALAGGAGVLYFVW